MVLSKTFSLNQRVVNHLLEKYGLMIPSFLIGSILNLEIIGGNGYLSLEITFLLMDYGLIWMKLQILNAREHVIYHKKQLNQFNGNFHIFHQEEILKRKLYLLMLFMMEVY